MEAILSLAAVYIIYQTVCAVWSLIADEPKALTPRQRVLQGREIFQGR